MDTKTTNSAAVDNASIPYKGVIFDMDGTLIESTEADYRAWERVFNDYGRQLSYSDYVPLLGVRSANVITDHLGFTEEKEVTRILKEKFDYFVEYIHQNPIEPVTAAEVFLKNLSKYPVKIGLATSSRKEKMQMVLEQLNFRQYFETVVTGEEVKNSKPAPDIFLKAAERLGLQPEECIVFEDGPVGVAAAKSANMKCIAITATHSADQLTYADVIIDSYEDLELKDIIKKFRN